MRRLARRAGTALLGLSTGLLGLWTVGAGTAAAAAPKVLLVGTYNGIPGPYTTIQAAVDAAGPGDYILVGPGDYKTTSSEAPTGGPPAGILIPKDKSGLYLIGMNRNTVIVDGTKSGPACSTAKADQNFGPSSSSGPEGLNGIMVWEASDVWVENMTVCNFLGGSGGDGGTGNEVWWNNDAGTGLMGPGKGFWGEYLTATSTYFDTEHTAAQYGIFSSNWNGGIFSHDYASNFNDSGFYIGACQNQCNQTVDHAWSEYSALGYSGSNSGGNMLIENSEFDNNQDGFDTNSQNGDNPPPQDGTCPNGGVSPITHTTSCWVFMHNYVHDNNNPNVPSAGLAGSGPVGTGMSLSGARNDTVMDNVFARNDAWGTILVPFPDSGPPCTGGTVDQSNIPSQIGSQLPCIYDEWGDAVIGNTYIDNGGFHNPTNGDIGASNLEVDATDCFSGNVSGNGGNLKISPFYAQTVYSQCTGLPVPPDLNPVFLDQVACDSGASIVSGVSGGSACLPGTTYPRQSKVVMHPLPGASSLENPSSTTLAGKANPCAGVPANPWCPKKPPKAAATTSAASVTSVTATAAGTGSSAVSLLAQVLGFAREPKA